MLNQLHTALKRLVHESGQIDPHEVDVRFEAPTRAWIGSLTLPTINLFLFDLQENAELRQTSFETTRGNGSATRRMVPRRYDLYYMVSTLSTSIVDEHLLLWRTLVTLMKHPLLPDTLLPEALRTIESPIAARVGRSRADDPRVLDLWSALEVPPRPALLYVVTIPVDLDITFEAPLVLTRRSRYQVLGDDAVLDTEGIHIGGTVRDKKGTPLSGVRVNLEGRGTEDSVTDKEGRFTLQRLSGGKATLCVTRGQQKAKKVTINIPSDSYDIVVD